MESTERIATIEGFIKTIEDINVDILCNRYAIMVNENPDVFNEYIFDPLMDAIHKMREAAELLKDATKALKAEIR